MSENSPPPASHHSGEDLLPTGMRRFVPLLVLVGIVISLVGFILGIREPRIKEYAVVSPRNFDAPPAPTYLEIPTAKLGPNARRLETLSQLKFEKPGIFDKVVKTEEMKQETLADRARNRAFDGAPPTIPHPVEAQSAASCLACHKDGIKVGNRIGSKISHAVLTNCTQCHVEQAAVPVENAFVGVYRSGPGDRASPGAPPTIPHHLWMREDCTSCHGLLTRPGTRTTHPWLTNCVQCHVAFVAKDQLRFLEAKR